MGHSKLRETQITADRETIATTTTAIFDLLQSNYKPHAKINSKFFSNPRTNEYCYYNVIHKNHIDHEFMYVSGGLEVDCKQLLFSDSGADVS